MTPQEPQEGRQWSPDVAEALDAIGNVLGTAVTPLAAALEEQREAAALLTANLVAAQEALGGLLGFIDRQGIRVSWAKDREMLESARALHTQLAPGGTHDGSPS